MNLKHSSANEMKRKRKIEEYQYLYRFFHLTTSNEVLIRGVIIMKPDLFVLTSKKKTNGIWLMVLKMSQTFISSLFFCPSEAKAAQHCWAGFMIKGLFTLYNGNKKMTNPTAVKQKIDKFWSNLFVSLCISFCETLKIYQN